MRPSHAESKSFSSLRLGLFPKHKQVDMQMENRILIYAAGFILFGILAVALASVFVKTLLRLLLAGILVLILYSIFWGEGSVYVSMVSQFFPECIQEDIMGGYDYYRQQEQIMPGWEQTWSTSE